MTTGEDPAPGDLADLRHRDGDLADLRHRDGDLADLAPADLAPADLATGTLAPAGLTTTGRADLDPVNLVPDRADLTTASYFDLKKSARVDASDGWR
jgi:uncharacterized protein YjbI with pentapeptide repeats